MRTLSSILLALIFSLGSAIPALAQDAQDFRVYFLCLEGAESFRAQCKKRCTFFSIGCRMKCNTSYRYDRELCETQHSAVVEAYDECIADAKQVSNQCMNQVEKRDCWPNSYTPHEEIAECVQDYQSQLGRCHKSYLKNEERCKQGLPIEDEEDRPNGGSWFYP